MFPALNQLADSGWLAGDELKNFISRKGFLIFCTSLIGLEIFPSSDCTRRQVIHSLDFLVLLPRRDHYVASRQKYKRDFSH